MIRTWLSTKRLLQSEINEFEMIKLISIHIPKTAGTSFYHILQQVYGEHLSISFKRRDYMKLIREKKELQFDKSVYVVHGHLYYHEVKKLHQTHQAKLITWLRHPVNRVISNYEFFTSSLHEPHRNLANYEINKHRLDEDILTYAEKIENRNRMSDFLKGIRLEQMLFIGIQENFRKDVERLGNLLDWPSVEIPTLNRGVNRKTIYPKAVLNQIANWNQRDIELYAKACELRDIPLDGKFTL